MMVTVHGVDEYYDGDEKEEPTKEGQKTKTSQCWSLSYRSHLAGKQDNKMEYMEHSCMSNVNFFSMLEIGCE